MKYKVPFIKPHFPDAQTMASDFQLIRHNNWFTNFGPFEKELCEKVKSRYPDGEAFVTTIANATLGLQSAIDLLIIKEGEKKEVIVPSFTFAAGPELLVKAGLRPVFVDINPSTLQPSILQAKDYMAKNREKIAGILFCNTFGVGSADIGEWELLANKYSVPLIVDSAAGFGSSYSKAEQIGLRGDCEVFSMHATKPFSVGEGGLVISKNEEFIEKVRSYQNFGFNSSRNISMIGTNAKLQELNCAIGIRQLVDLNSRLEGRRQTLQMYKQLLDPFGFVVMMNADLSTVCFASVLAPTPKDAELLQNVLELEGIEVRKYYTPLHEQDELMKRSRTAGSLEVTEDVSSRILSLPVHDNMSNSDLDLITQAIREMR